MRIFSKRQSLLLLTAMLALVGPSIANADGLYFGGGIYVSEAETDDLHEADETTGFQVGYTLVDSNFFMFAVEIGAYDLGDYSDDGIDVEAEALGLGVVATLPLGPFIELYGKIGSAEVEVEINDESFDGTEAYYGAGIAFDIVDTIDIYLEYLEFDTEVDSRSVGVGIRLDLF